MSGEEGFKVASGYVSVVPSDEDFEALLTEKVDAACAAAGSSGGKVLTEQLMASFEVIDSGLSDSIVAALGGAGVVGGQELAAGVAAALAESGDAGAGIGARVVEELASAGTEGGAAMAAGIEASMDGVYARLAAADEAYEAAQKARIEAMAAYETEMAAATSLEMKEVIDGGMDSALGDATAALMTARTASKDALAEVQAAQVAMASAVTGVMTVSEQEWKEYAELFPPIGEEAAAGLSEAMLAGTANTGTAIAAQVSEMLQQGLDDEAQALMATLPSVVEASAATAGGEIGAAISNGIGEQIALWAEEEAPAAIGEMSEEMLPEAAAAGTRTGEEWATTMNAAMSREMDAFIVAGGGPIAAAMAQFSQLELNELANVMDAAVSKNMGILQESAGSISKVGTAAKGASSELGGMGAMMGGPWMMALYGGMMVLPMLSGVLKDLGGESDAVTLSQTGLASAITASSGTAGDSVASYVASQAQLSGLADAADRAGLNLATYTEAVLGNVTAQNQVTTAVDAQNAALSKKGPGPGDPRGGGSAPYAGPAADQIASNDQLTASMQAQNAQIMKTIEDQAALTQALMIAEGSAQVFQATMDATYTTMQSSAQQSAISAVAMLNLGDAHTSTSQAIESTVQAYDEAQSRAAGYTTVLDALTVATDGSAASNQKNAQYINILDEVLGNLSTQADLAAAHTAQASVAALDLGTSNTALNVSLIDSESAYTLAQQGATAYGTALTDANGSVVGMIGSQAAVTTSLDNFTTGLKTNGKSLDDSTAKGAANVTNALATAAAVDKATTAVFQNTDATQGSVAAYQAANTYLDKEKQAFIEAADKAGLNKTAVQELANEIFQLPALTPINFTSNISSIQAQVSTMVNAVAQIGGGGIIDIKLPGARAGGGPVQAGQPYIVGEKRAELFVPEQDGTIIPSVPGARGGGPAAPGGQVTFNYYGTQQPSAEQRADMMLSLAGVGAF